MGDAAVIGAGVLGLAVAQRLRARGHNVTVFEGSANLGGLASGWDVGGTAWDRHHHVLVASDSRTRHLLRSIGMEHELRWDEATSALYPGQDAGLQPFSNAVDLLRWSSLNPIDKARLGATILAGATVQDRERMERLSAEEWLTRWSGRRAFEDFWRPVLRAKLGDEWQKAPATFVSATIQRNYSARQGHLRHKRLGHVPGGFARILDRFAASLTDAGVKIDVGVPVRSIQPARSGLELQLDDASAHFDQVVATTATPLAAELCPSLTDAEHERLLSVRYVGVVCASVLLSRKLTSFFSTYVTDPSAPFSTVVEMTALIDPAEVDGWNLVYLTHCAASDDPVFDLDDRATRSMFLTYLARMHPSLETAEVGAFKVSRVRRVFAVPAIGDARAMPSTTTSIPGLQLIGSANLPFAALSVNDTLALVEELR